MKIGWRRFARPSFRGVVVLTIVLGGGAGVYAIVTDLTDVKNVHSAAAVHADQQELMALVLSGQDEEAFDEAFELGDELFATLFNAIDGVGANVGRGQRFTRVPRADLKGTGEWFRHTPARVTGPNSNACNSCHFRPFEDGAGDASANVHRDTFRTGLVSQFVQRNTPHVFAPGAIQRLAEEMTDELFARRQGLVDSVCAQGGTKSVSLQAKFTNYGILKATRTVASPCQVTFDTSGVRGIDFQRSIDNPSALPDLIVRPFQWKGSVPFLRDFNRGASHNELGMQAVEVVGDDVDGDFDGVKNEMTIGDQTALSVYMAGQPRPTSLIELSALGLIDPLPAARVTAIARGAVMFAQAGCATCHIPAMVINTPVYSEPSTNAAYRDGAAFPAGQNPIARGVDPAHPIHFDLTRDQPDNRITLPNGTVFPLGSLRRDGQGRGIVELFGDLKRHEMGSRLAEPVNEIAGDDVTPIPLNPLNRHTPGTFLTENLWGVGSTPPYMHDGRATTLAEAIIEHATGASNDISEAKDSRARYLALGVNDKKALIAFLENLVLFKTAEEDGLQVATIAPQGEDVKLRIPRATIKRKLGTTRLEE
jgi:cytochrome c551/c552